MSKRTPRAVKQEKPSAGREFKIELLNSAQKLAWAAFQKHDVLFLLGPAGSGKALPLNSKLYTKDGIILMKDVKIGQKIAAPDGNFYSITGIYPQGLKEINRITFNDGTKIDCCEEHLWSVNQTRSKWYENKVVDTNFIYNYYQDKKNNYKLFINCTEPVDFEEKSFYINPYVLGNLIADGCFRGSNVSFTTVDEEIVDNYNKFIPSDYFVKRQKNIINYHIIRKQKKNSQNDLKSELIKLNLWDLKSENKHIPKEYLFGNKEQRIALLQGLMDGDGGVNKTSGTPIFYTTSAQLLEDFKFLINSLGGTLKIIEKETKYKNKNGDYVKCKNIFCCSICLPNEIDCFSLNRKLKLVKKRIKYFPKRIIEKIEKLNVQTEMQCITINSPDRLFLVNEFIVTHNTFLATAFAIKSFLAKEKEKIVLTRPIVEAGESLGFLPGPQPLSANIATPTGWKKMGDIKVGDLVIGRDGKPTLVEGVFPKGTKKVYKLTTSDGTTTECCIDHYWHTQTFEDAKRKKVGSVKSTKQILESFKTKNGKPNHYLPRNQAVEYNEQLLPLSPYALGVLLGDGHLGNSISFSSIDQELVNKFSNEILDLGITLTEHNRINSKVKSYTLNSNVIKNKPSRKICVSTGVGDNLIEQIYNDLDEVASEFKISKSAAKYRCTKEISILNNKFRFIPLTNRWSHPVKKIMEDLGLQNKKAWEKFIPQIFKYSSIEQRLELLRGLMDTNGTIKKTGEASFSTTSKLLALDVIEIVRSLGGRAKISERKRKGSHNLKGRNIISRRTSYEFTISLPENMNPFFIKRKASRFKCKYIHKVAINSIDFIGEKEVQCIRVNNSEHLYLTDNFIVTHNTFEEKVNPYMMPIHDCIDKLLGVESPLKEKLLSRTEVAPIAYMRGRSFNDSICIFDEAQNATKSQLKLFLTRFGRDSKLIITGDPRQSDIGSASGLAEVVNRLKDVPGIGVIEFQNNSIVRHPLIASILDKLEDVQ